MNKDYFKPELMQSPGKKDKELEMIRIGSDLSSSAVV